MHDTRTLIRRLANLIGQIRKGKLDARELEYLCACVDHFDRTRAEWRNQR